MHFEILVEGQTELTTLSILLPEIIGEFDNPHTWKIHKHQGIGALPIDLDQIPEKQNRTLLHNFPSKLQAYGKTMTDREMVVLLLDLDEVEDCIEFKNRLLAVLEICEPKPKLLVRFAVEEIEAWFLGDVEAIKKAFAEPKIHLLNGYIQDSICGTWELLAEIVHEGGLANLIQYGRRSTRVLEQKRIWAARIAPHMNADSNNSESFRWFRQGLIQNLD